MYLYYYEDTNIVSKAPCSEVKVFKYWLDGILLFFQKVKIVFKCYC